MVSPGGPLSEPGDHPDPNAASTQGYLSLQDSGNDLQLSYVAPQQNAGQRALVSQQSFFHRHSPYVRPSQNFDMRTASPAQLQAHHHDGNVLPYNRYYNIVNMSPSGLSEASPPARHSGFPQRNFPNLGFGTSNLGSGLYGQGYSQPLASSAQATRNYISSSPPDAGGHGQPPGSLFDPTFQTPSPAHLHSSYLSHVSSGRRYPSVYSHTPGTLSAWNQSLPTIETRSVSADAKNVSRPSSLQLTSDVELPSSQPDKTLQEISDEDEPLKKKAERKKRAKTKQQEKQAPAVIELPEPPSLGRPFNLRRAMDTVGKRFRGFIRNMDEVEPINRHYLTFYNVTDPKKLGSCEDFPEDTESQVVLVKRLFEAMINIDNILDPPSSQALARIRNNHYSDLEFELLSWKLLICIRDAQLGVCDYPRAAQSSELKYERFKNFRDRFKAVEQILTESKQSVTTGFEPSFANRLAWAPNIELQKKKNNKKINIKRDYQVSLGSAVIKADEYKVEDGRILKKFPDGYREVTDLTERVKQSIICTFNEQAVHAVPTPGPGRSTGGRVGGRGGSRSGRKRPKSALDDDEDAEELLNDAPGDDTDKADSADEYVPRAVRRRRAPGPAARAAKRRRPRRPVAREDSSDGGLGNASPDNTVIKTEAGMDVDDQTTRHSAEPKTDDHNALDIEGDLEGFEREIQDGEGSHLSDIPALPALHGLPGLPSVHTEILSDPFDVQSGLIPSSSNLLAWEEEPTLP